jgi:hypothetical protein
VDDGVVGGAVVTGALVVAPGTVVVAPGAVVEVATVLMTGVAVDSRFGRRNQTSAAVITITVNDARTAVTTSRRSRGGFHPALFARARGLGFIASAPYR